MISIYKYFKVISSAIKEINYLLINFHQGHQLLNEMKVLFSYFMDKTIIKIV